MGIKWFIILLVFLSKLESIDRFIVITAERSGTHLLTRAISYLTGKKVKHLWDRNASTAVLVGHLDKSEAEGMFFHMHAFPYPHIIDLFKARGYKIVFLLRDPRDQLLSVLHYIRDVKWEYESLRMDFPFGQLSFDEQIDEMITGQRYGICVPEEFFSKRFVWMNLQDQPCFTARFENLVGIKGGGNRESQIRELRNLATFLHIDISQERIEEIANNLFGGDALRNGIINVWKTEFKDYHKINFKIKYGSELIRLGYEKDLEW